MLDTQALERISPLFQLKLGRPLLLRFFFMQLKQTATQLT